MPDQLNYWHWWILGVVLIVLEVLAPGTFFLWLAIAAAIVGAVLLVAPGIGWEYQFFLFAVLSVASIIAWRVYLQRHPTPTDRPTLNRRGEQYVGRVFTLDEPIVDGLGKLKVDDSTWKIEGADCAAGARVKVVGVDGVILKVEGIER